MVVLMGRWRLLCEGRPILDLHTRPYTVHMCSRIDGGKEALAFLRARLSYSSATLTSLNVWTTLRHVVVQAHLSLTLNAWGKASSAPVTSCTELTEEDPSIPGIPHLPRTSVLGILSDHLIPQIKRRHRRWKAFSCFMWCR